METEKEILRRLARLEEGQRDIRMLVFLTNGLICSVMAKMWCEIKGFSEEFLIFLIILQGILLTWHCVRGFFR